jgi:hypothetical protein
MLVGGVLVAYGGLVSDQRRTGVEGERLEAGLDDRTTARFSNSDLS